MNALIGARSLAILTVILTGCGSASSGGTPATITVQPTDQDVVVGATARFNVIATNAIGYRWQRSADGGGTFDDVSGGTSDSYTTPATTLADGGKKYRVIVTGVGNSIVSSTASLTVTAAPVAPAITAHPADQTVTAGQDATFSITATGTSLTYQWQESADGGATFAGLSGATLATLVRRAVPLTDDDHRFRVVVTNGAGSATSSAARLTVKAASTSAPPSFTAQPADRSVVAPGTATFDVVAAGSPAPALQWQLSTDGGGTFADIPGATSASYTTPIIAGSDSGNRYRAVATNASGTATSSVARLTVTVSVTMVAPSFTAQPVDLIVSEGQDATFVVSASGTPAPTLRWQSSPDGGASWSDIPGATGAVFTLARAVLADNGRQLRAVATNGAGSTNSTPATLMVKPAVATKAWGPTVRISPDVDGDVYLYQVAFGANGDAMAVWQDSDGVRSNIWANRYTPGAGWGTPALLEVGDGSAQDAQVAVDANGNAIAVWSQDGMLPNCCDYHRNDIWASVYVAGTGWGSAFLLETIDGDFSERAADSPQIAMADNGKAIVAWNQGDANSGSSVWATTYTPAAGWAVPALVEADAGAAGGQAVAIDASGNTMVVWSQLVGADINAWASRNSGTPQRIETTVGGNPSQLRIAMNAGGTAVAVWTQSCSTWANAYLPASGWGTATALQTGVSSCAAISSPQIVIDAGGNAVAAWVISTGASSTTWIDRYTPGGGWAGATAIKFGVVEFQVATNAAGDTLGAWRQGAGVFANDAHVVPEAWSSAVDVFPAGFGPELAMDGNGNAVMLVKQAQASGRNTLWASVFK